MIDDIDCVFATKLIIMSVEEKVKSVSQKKLLAIARGREFNNNNYFID